MPAVRGAPSFPSASALFSRELVWASVAENKNAKILCWVPKMAQWPSQVRARAGQQVQEEVRAQGSLGMRGSSSSSRFGVTPHKGGAIRGLGLHINRGDIIMSGS